MTESENDGEPPGALPSLETVRDRARAGAGGDGVNLLARPVDGRDPLEGVALESVDAEAGESADDAYVGDGAARVGLLAAAATAAADGDARLHYPEVDLTADGPWLVLEPLAGRLGTVARGSATATVDLERGDRRLETDEERLSTVLEAARPRHDHYPVADDQGIFTTGMTTFSLADVRVDPETLSVVLDVETTPSTTASAVEDRFADCPGVRDVRLVRASGVQRAAPDAAVRDAVEAAHVSVRGDCEYAWLPPDAPFTQVPGPNRLALGTGVAGEPFDADDFETCRRLLERTLAALEGAR